MNSRSWSIPSGVWTFCADCTDPRPSTAFSPSSSYPDRVQASTTSLTSTLVSMGPAIVSQLFFTLIFLFFLLASDIFVRYRLAFGREGAKA